MMIAVQLTVVAALIGAAAASKFKWESWMDPTLPAPHSTHALHHRPPPSARSQRKLRAAELTPLFPGYGTHYAYAYVGTPPQRQSLIIDTGSHFTAFPCAGCAQCGKHTDAYFDPQNSSTASVPKCLNNQLCLISQSYTEGSAWHGYKVMDKLWVGGTASNLLPGAERYSVDFTFGCQTSETGLFRTQLADGIMGMSASEDTLPAQLLAQNATSSRVFALCFRVGGGIMTVGGVDQRIHSQKTVNYAKLVPRSQGLYGVELTGIKLVSSKGEATRVDAHGAALSGGDKGVIVDSGTTDTYLPAELAKGFADAFKRASGVAFASGSVSMSAADLARLPAVVFELTSTTSNRSVEVTMPMASYVDSVGDGKYAFRIYLSEKQGTVLGANFMNNYNVIFDADGQRVGFAKSNCNFEEFAPALTAAPTARPSARPGDAPSAGAACGEADYTPYTECTARCTRNESAYIATGTQDYINKCNPNDADIKSRPCEETCSFFKIVRGDPHCPDTEWSECTHGCIMSRFSVPLTEPLYTHSGRCNYKQQTQTCYAGVCPRQDGDFLIYLDMRVRVEPYRWSYVYTEAFFAALTQIFKLRGNAIELLNNAGNEYTPTTKLHFQIRIKASGYADRTALHDAAEKVVTGLRDVGFGALLVQTLDHLPGNGNPKQSRFGWLFAQDVEVLSAVALPIGDVRDPHSTDANPDVLAEQNSRAATMRDMLLVGVALGALVVLVAVLYMHFRLRQEYALMSKDKSTLAKSTSALRKLWARFQQMAHRPQDVSGGNVTAMGGKMNSLSLEEMQREMEMSRMGLMESDEEDGFADERH